jgi:glycosyltransferase involved in cell wall biosynthesis
MYNPDGTKCIVLSVSRMESWKRVDRILDVISCAVKKHGAKNLLYIAAGEGSMLAQYQQRVREEGLDEYVVFTGALPHDEVKKYLNVADIFMSTYDLSNVGNPLLEAIRANKIIFTLNNGATGEWIRHRENGFIYNVDEHLIENMATDLVALMQDESLKNLIKINIEITEHDKLWSWQERMDAEIKAVESIVKES